MRKYTRTEDEHEHGHVQEHEHERHTVTEATLSVDFETIKLQFAFKIEYLSDEATLSLLNVIF
jgi:hypothetical protein